jgi:hypothetical protein
MEIKIYITEEEVKSNNNDHDLGRLARKKFWDLKLKEPSSEESELYSQIENAIIKWSIEETETAGSLTREIMKLIEKK